MKIKVFTNLAAEIEDLVNEWLSKNNHIKILNRTVTTDWVGPTPDNDNHLFMKCMITIIYEYEEMQEEHENGED